MNEHFLTDVAGCVSLYGIIGALIMLIYNSHEHALNYIQVALIMFTQDHLHGYPKTGAFTEPEVLHLYEPTVPKKKIKKDLRLEYENILA